MSESRLRPGSVLLKLACAVLLLGGAAQARHEACDATRQGASAACLARVATVDVRDIEAGGETIAMVAGVGSATAGSTLAVWQPERRMAPTVTAGASTESDASSISSANEPPLLGLLLAVLGVVGFVAHRRSGR